LFSPLQDAMLDAQDANDTESMVDAPFAKQLSMYAELPNGDQVPPSDFGGGWHGTDKIEPFTVESVGMPSRGSCLSLLDHAEHPSEASAFRGTGCMAQEAAAWAGEGGWVYLIQHVPTWRLVSLLDGRIMKPDGTYRGLLMRGEQEGAILARVEPESVKRIGVVYFDFRNRPRIDWPADG